MSEIDNRKRGETMKQYNFRMLPSRMDALRKKCKQDLIGNYSSLLRTLADLYIDGTLSADDIKELVRQNQSAKGA